MKQYKFSSTFLKKQVIDMSMKFTNMSILKDISPFKLDLSKTNLKISKTAHSTSY